MSQVRASNILGAVVEAGVAGLNRAVDVLTGGRK